MNDSIANLLFAYYLYNTIKTSEKILLETLP